MYKFHRKCGDRVTLLNQNLTAIRNFVEFNHGLILSAEPLANDVLFEVRIDRKVNVWNGSLEIGVTTLDPDVVELPATATKLRNTAWILSGNTIVKDGITVLNTNWPELDSLQEGDCIAVSRSNKAELMFFINGRCLGIAAKELPEKLFAVIDLYGQCVQVSIVHSNYLRTVMDLPFESTTSEPAAATSAPRPHEDTLIQMPVPNLIVTSDNLRFHPRCGILVKLSNNNKSAERARPLDDYNNGVVMTHRPLRDNELFEIRIDKLVDKWSGSIEVGVTSHNPATIRFPSTMTNMDSGTIMMSGCKVLMNGQGACMEYGNFNLDELREGDTVGMIRKSSGKLHYFINGIDQGVATDKVPSQVWGVIDLYGMTVKVTVVDPGEDLDSNINSGALRSSLGPIPDGPEDDEIGAAADCEPNPALVALSPEGVLALFSNSLVEPSTSSYEPTGCARVLEEDQLLFHTLRDSHVIIINNGRTAHRPNAFEVFNNGFVMTNRTLKTNELFQVRLDLVIPKWAGSIEIGITQHSSNDIVFPFRMINATSGTWCIVGEDVIRDGTIIIPQYVRNLSRLVEGDTVGVMRKEMGILHFFVNGVDQGPAAFNIPEHVFGIIDLYGRVAQATIVDTYTPLPVSSPESPISFCSNATVLPEMCFHRVHGHNARLSRNRLTASRATVYSEFNDAVLFSSRPLRECDMFEIRIEKMVDCWIGSLEIGVTAIRPDDLEANGGLGALAGTATDLSWDTYILSGSAMMKDGECIRSGYPLDLDTLTVGSRVGMMWHADRSLHYYLDGMDMGKAWYVPHLNIYAVVDLYGQCTQVTIMQNEERAFNYNGCNTDHGIANPRSLPTPTPPYWSFSEYHGDNVSLSKDYTFARRITPDPMGALVFSSTHLIVNELYEIQIVECKYSYAGSFRIGVTDINVLNANINRHLPLCVSWLPHFTAYIDGKYIKYSRPGPTREKDLQSFVPSFDWLRPGDRIGLKKTEDSRVLVYYNSELLDVAFEKIPDKVYVLMEMYGRTTKIQTVSRGINVMPGTQQTIPNDKPETTAASTEGLNIPKIPEEIAPVLLDSDEISEMAVEHCEELANPTQSGLPENTIQTGPEITNSTQEENACALSLLNGDNASLKMAEVKIFHTARPYTFHYVTGSNIQLHSSDTVALRHQSYNHGVAVASWPLRKGTTFRYTLNDRTIIGTLPASFSGTGPDARNATEIFAMSYELDLDYPSLDNTIGFETQPGDDDDGMPVRVDQVAEECRGTLNIGAVAMRPTETPPSTALHLTTPCWVVTDDILYVGGVYSWTDIAYELANIDENSVLALHFRTNNDLVLDIESDYRCIIANIPSQYDEIYPLLDLYGRIAQVSILLHPILLHAGVSLDLSIIEEQEEVPDDDLSQNVHPASESDADDLGDSPDHDEYTSFSDELEGDNISHSYERTLSGDCDIHSVDDGQSGNAAEDESIAIDNSSPVMEALEDACLKYEALYVPDAVIDDPQFVLNAKDATNTKIKARSLPPKASLHQSLKDTIIAGNNLAAESCGLNMSQSTQLPSQNVKVIEETSNTPLSEDPIVVADNDLAAESRGLNMSQSTQLPSQNVQVIEEGSPLSEDPSTGDSMINPLGLGSRILDDDSDSPEETCDTNIRHNNKYPEANVNESCHDNDGLDASDANDDNFDNVFMDAMFLETSNMPDLNEEQSLSLDDSTTTRPDDCWPQGLSVENLHYLNGIVCNDQRAAAAAALDRDWVFYSETNRNCEVMHFALKFWNDIVAPYSDLRDIVTTGNVHCFCHNCHPDADPMYSGWVRIERANRQESPSIPPVRMYWHLARATITSALALRDESAVVRRPRQFCCGPSTAPAHTDIWIDDEGKPHQSALALDVDISGDNPENDRLLAYWIYLRSHASMMLEAEDIEDTVGDAVDDIEQDAVEDIVEDAVEDMTILLVHDAETMEEAAVASFNDTYVLDQVQSETDDQIGETEE